MSSVVTLLGSVSPATASAMIDGLAPKLGWSTKPEDILGAKLCLDEASFVTIFSVFPVANAGEFPSVLAISDFGQIYKFVVTGASASLPTGETATIVSASYGVSKKTKHVIFRLTTLAASDGSTKEVKVCKCKDGAAEALLDGDPVLCYVEWVWVPFPRPLCLNDECPIECRFQESICSCSQ
ncbi:MAG: hypothetical protein JNJ88_19290 [Planctomycetes bacterium]|nr:hypothetical protein [Planctomycetota bacterium]